MGHVGLQLLDRLVVRVSDVVEERRVGARGQPRQQRAQRLPDVADEAERDVRAPAEVGRVVVDLDDRRPVGQEHVVGEVGAEHEQQVALAHRLRRPAPAEQPGHPDRRRVVVLDHVLAAVGIGDRRLQRLRELEDLVARGASPLAAVDDDLARAGDERGGPVQRRIGRTDQRTLGDDGVLEHRLGHLRRADVAREDHHADPALEDRRLERELGQPRHLVGRGDHRRRSCSSPRRSPRAASPGSSRCRSGSAGCASRSRTPARRCAGSHRGR